MKIFIIAGILLYLFFPLIRVIVKNLHLIIVYSIVDLIEYIRLKKWRDFNLYGIDLFIYRDVWAWKNFKHDTPGTAYI